MVLTEIPFDARFDLAPWVGQQQSTFTFVLIDGVSNQILGNLNPIRDAPPVLSHDISRTIPRTFNLTLAARDSSIINPVNNRLLVYMNVGSDRWPLGRYVFIDSSEERYTSGKIATLTLADEMFILDQPIQTCFSSILMNSTPVSGLGDVVSPLEYADQTIMRLLSGSGIQYHVEATSFSSIGSWPVGTNKAQILNNLSIDGDYLLPWINNYGILQVIRSFDPARRIPDFDFDTSRKIIAGSIVESNNLLEAANRIIVVSNGVSSDINAQSAVTGIFDVPQTAPHSSSNRGFVVPKIYTRQVDSVTQAEQIARNIGLRDTAYEIVSLDTPPDPRHDGYNVIRWDNKQWLEVSWSMTMAPGGLMNHVMQRVYS